MVHDGIDSLTLTQNCIYNQIDRAKLKTMYEEIYMVYRFYINSVSLPNFTHNRNKNKHYNSGGGKIYSD